MHYRIYPLTPVNTEILTYDANLSRFHETALNRREYAHFRQIMLNYGLSRNRTIKIHLIEGIFTMARNNYSVEFVDCNLTKEHVPQLEKYMAGFKNDLGMYLPHILNLGYQLKLGAYPDKQSYAVFMSSAQGNRENKGKMLSSWSDDPIECLFMCGFKHEVILGGGEWDVEDNPSRWG